MFRPGSRTRQRSGRGSNNNSSQSSTMRQMSNTLHGTKIVPSDDPPVIQGSPWNNVIIYDEVDVKAGDYTYFSLANLRSAMMNQLGFAGKDVPVNFEVCIQTVQAWAFTTKSDQIHFGMFPLAFGTGTELVRIDSNSMKNKYAKCGYKYPLVYTSQPISTAGNDLNLVSFIADLACKAMVHISIKWRGASQGFKALMWHWHVPKPIRPRITESDANTPFEELCKDLTHVIIDEVGYNLNPTQLKRVKTFIEKDVVNDVVSELEDCIQSLDAINRSAS